MIFLVSQVLAFTKIILLQVLVFYKILDYNTERRLDILLKSLLVFPRMETKIHSSVFCSQNETIWMLPYFPPYLL